MFSFRTRSAFGLLALSALVHAPASAGPTEIRTVATFAMEPMLESIADAGSGHVFVSGLTTGRIYRVDIASGRFSLWAQLPAGGGDGFAEALMGIVSDGKGGLYANILSRDAVRHGVWHVSRDRLINMIAPLPLTMQPNGLARGSDGTLYIGESGHGAVWQIKPGESHAGLWAEHALLEPRQTGRQFPAVNGVQVAGRKVYVTVSDTARLVAIPIGSNRASGTPVVIADKIAGDDFAIDVDGTFFVTTHPFNTVVRVAGSTRHELGNASNGVVGPTAAIIARPRRGRRQLFVVTDGGFYAPIAGGRQPSRLIAIKLPPR